MVAGDGENDLPLFELTDLSFAPEDGPEDTKVRVYRVLGLQGERLLTPILRTTGA